MTERERAQDELLLAIGNAAALSVYRGPDDKNPDANLVLDAMRKFRAASAKQDDEDRNGVRRVMGTKDCAEKVTKPGVCGKCGSDRFAYVVPGKWQCVKCGDGAGAEPPTPNRISACTQVAPGCRERCGTSELCDIKQD